MIHNKNSAFAAPVVVTKISETMVCGLKFNLTVFFSHALKGKDREKEEEGGGGVEAVICKKIGSQDGQGIVSQSPKAIQVL